MNQYLAIGNSLASEHHWAVAAHTKTDETFHVIATVTTRQYAQQIAAALNESVAGHPINDFLQAENTELKTLLDARNRTVAELMERCDELGEKLAAAIMGTTPTAATGSVSPLACAYIDQHLAHAWDYIDSDGVRSFYWCDGVMRGAGGCGLIRRGTDGAPAHSGDE